MGLGCETPTRFMPAAAAQMVQRTAGVNKQHVSWPCTFGGEVVHVDM